jgi:hypothetical protein
MLGTCLASVPFTAEVSSQQSALEQPFLADYGYW